jgi:tRNA(fMet)-specific endonuclease VapC
VSERTLLDTDIFSEVIKGKNASVSARADAYMKAHGRLTISVITVLESTKGLQKAQRPDAMTRFVGMLPSLDVLGFGIEEALVAGRIYGDLERTGQPIGRADPMIAAVAITNAIALATGNGAHYERIRALGYALRLENWRDP